MTTTTPTSSNNMEKKKIDIVRHGRNVHSINVGASEKFLLISDLHWDNPHCDRDLLKNHLDEAVKRNAIIIINGDMLCCMQGKGDPRRSKDDIRPEHNNARYLDSIVETAVEWFAPYVHNIALIGYGNHETGIIKHQETDILRRFVDMSNHVYGSNMQVGGYGGVVSVSMQYRSQTKPKTTCFVMHYFHGSAGGGQVTRGVISDQRILASVEGYDCTWQGHVHELYHHVNVVHRFDVRNKLILQRYVNQLRTATYKEEWDGGVGGFHVERGRQPKPLGGYWMDLSVQRIQESKKGSPSSDRVSIISDFYACTRPY